MAKEIERNFYLIESFDEIRLYYEQLFAHHRINLLYKIRNWRERFHPEFLIKGEIYFTKPNELNDPFDIHRPVQFDVSVIDKPEFLHLLTETAPDVWQVNPGRDAKIIAEKKLDEIKKNPTAYFVKNYEDMLSSPAFNDSIGVFSLTKDPCNEQLWGYYGGGLNGFAVGFDAIRICEELFSQGHFVTYTDAIPFSNIINVSQKEQSDLWFQKTEKWAFENEFRFTRAIDQHNQTRRKHYYSPSIVKEIILGPRIPDDDKEAILRVAKERYNKAKVFQLKCNYSKGILYPVEI